MAKCVHFIGLVSSPASWAKVSREIIRALSRAGVYVSAVSLKGHLYNASWPLAGEVKEALRRRRLDGWDLALDYPPNFARLDGKRRAGILIYEADRFPSHWAEAIERRLDLAIVPSAFCLEAAAASGVSRSRLALAPFGVDADVHRPEGPRAEMPTGRSFNFLAVAAPHVRKGLKETVAAFAGAFLARDDVGLVIKCPPRTRLGKRPWEYRSVADFLPDRREGQVSLIEASHTESDMAALYRGADVYVQASYGEAFGLAPLEAAACGKPVIATAWGAAPEIFGSEGAYLVEYDLVDAGAFAYDWRGGGTVRMARPRVRHLVETMRRAYEDSSERASKASGAARVAEEFTWQQCARAISAALVD